MSGTALRTALAGLTMACAAVLAPGFAAAEVNTYTEALMRAYSTNPTLLAQRAALRATDEGVNQAISGWRPNVTASYSYSRNDSDGTRDRLADNPATPEFDPSIPITDESGGVTTTKTASVTARQNVFRGLQTYNELRQAKANVRAGRAQLTATEQDVLFDAITAYVDVIRDEAVVRLSENSVNVLRNQLEAAEDRRVAGVSTRTDVAQARARLSGGEATEIDARAQLVVSKAAFERIVGDIPGTLTPLPEPGAIPELLRLPASEQEAVEIALNNNPTLTAIREQEEASRRAVKAAMGTLLPTATIEGTYSSSDSDLDNNDPFSDAFQGTASETDQFAVAAQVTVPLYQSGAEYSAIRQAKQLNSQDRIQIAETERQVRETVAAAFAALRSAEGRITSSEAQLEANRVAFEGVKQEAMVGSRTTLDVLDAEQEVLDSGVALERAKRDYYVAAFQVLASVGRLTARDLSLQVSLYDPTENYENVSSRWIGWWGTNDE